MLAQSDVQDDKATFVVRAALRVQVLLCIAVFGETFNSAIKGLHVYASAFSGRSAKLGCGTRIAGFAVSDL